MYRKVD